MWSMGFLRLTTTAKANSVFHDLIWVVGKRSLSYWFRAISSASSL
ncbi:chromosomal replication initiator DnaA domain protein [Burkholderia pseudomallei MSHR5608]|nr:chromosomal replication initiator DnaA domain protein [Burkholderia pseudomallei MSHR5608]